MGYKRLMTDIDKEFSFYLQELLDKDSTSYEDKLKIIAWFDSFDYPEDMTVKDMMLIHAAQLF